MSWIRDITQCPRCGYKAAEEQRRITSFQLNIFCLRCGYSIDRFFNSAKRDALKKASSKTDSICEFGDLSFDWEIDEQCWDQKVAYPNGSCIYRCKGKEVFTYNSIEEVSIKKLLENLDKYDVCKHTFYKSECWYIKDLHTNTTTLFSEAEYHRCRLK